MELKDLFLKYIYRLYHYVPSDLYMVLLSVFCILSILLITFKGVKVGSKVATGIFFFEYVTLLLCSTVLFRKSEVSIGYDFTPFWSYQAIQNGRDELLVENIMNVVVFVPVGLLLSCVSPRLKWWMVLLIGFGISLSIESSQYVLKRGFSEVDDVIHNTLGCAIGVMIVAFIKGIWKFCSYLFVPQWGKHRDGFLLSKAAKPNA